jgi:hypothetical protein
LIDQLGILVLFRQNEQDLKRHYNNHKCFEIFIFFKIKKMKIQKKYS